jgi:hypothetical protein
MRVCTKALAVVIGFSAKEWDVSIVIQMNDKIFPRLQWAAGGPLRLPTPPDRFRTGSAQLRSSPSLAQELGGPA